MLTLAYGWNIGIQEGGRRVNAGWTKAARWAKGSVPWVANSPGKPAEHERICHLKNETAPFQKETVIHFWGKLTDIAMEMHMK